MPTLRRRVKKMVRKKFKKTIKLSDVDKIWMEYVEHAVIKPLLKFGKGEIDGKTNVEIVGKKIVDDPQSFNLLVKGLNVTRNGTLKPAVKFDGRPDVKYKIVLTDSNHKGTLLFKADAKLSKRVHEELKNTNTYYRICQ